MLTVMDMSTGKVIEGSDDGFGAFRDQVLNAEWIPRQPELQPRLQHIQAQSSSVNKFSPGMDVEAFLASMYSSQR